MGQHPSASSTRSRWTRCAATAGNHPDDLEAQDREEDALAYWTALATDGDLDAQFRVGCLHASAEDHATGAHWFRAAAEYGHAGAQFRLGLCYQRGEGAAVDYKEAVNWFRLASQTNSADAQIALGCAYQLGTGVARDYAKATKWYEAALALGTFDDGLYAVVASNLAFCWENGLGAAGAGADLDEAIPLYCRAAARGSSFALGRCAEKGWGMRADAAKAVSAYRKAATNGDDCNACFHLGLCHEAGRGVEVNPAEARRWLRFAADRGHEQAAAALARVTASAAAAGDATRPMSCTARNTGTEAASSSRIAELEALLAAVVEERDRLADQVAATETRCHHCGAGLRHDT